jgi:hypothetical protein
LLVKPLSFPLGKSFSCTGINVRKLNLLYTIRIM